MTPAEVAQYLQMPRWHIWRRLLDGQIRSEGRGFRRTIREADLEEYIERHMINREHRG